MPTKADNLREFDAQQRAITEQRAQLSEHERQLSELRLVLDEQLRNWSGSSACSKPDGCSRAGCEAGSGSRQPAR